MAVKTASLLLLSAICIYCTYPLHYTIQPHSCIVSLNVQHSPIWNNSTQEMRKRTNAVLGLLVRYRASIVWERKKSLQRIPELCVSLQLQQKENWLNKYRWVVLCVFLCAVCVANVSMVLPTMYTSHSRYGVIERFEKIYYLK